MENVAILENLLAEVMYTRKAVLWVKSYGTCGQGFKGGLGEGLEDQGKSQEGNLHMGGIIQGCPLEELPEKGVRGKARSPGVSQDGGNGGTRVAVLRPLERPSCRNSKRSPYLKLLRV